MDKPGKLKLILEVLYKYRNKNTLPTVEDICRDQKIPLNLPNEAVLLAEELEREGLITANFNNNGVTASLTTKGLEEAKKY